MRDVNKRGASINRDALVVRALLQHGLRSPTAAAYLTDATAHCETLATAVHTGARLDRDVEEETSHFMKFSEARFSDPALRSSVRVAKKSPEEAAADMAAGRWDPFATVELPGHERAEPAPPPKARPPTWQSLRDG
jgi:hypothetical protein